MRQVPSSELSVHTADSTPCLSGQREMDGDGPLVSLSTGSGGQTVCCTSRPCSNNQSRGLYYHEIRPGTHEPRIFLFVLLSAATLGCALPGRHADSTWSEHNCAHIHTYTTPMPTSHLPRFQVKFGCFCGPPYPSFPPHIQTLHFAPPISHITLPHWHRRMHLIVVQCVDGVYFRISFAAGE